jgi:two-component system, NarL family, nitrate/nitrite response regulator NarL
MTRVLIADDHPFILDGVQAFLGGTDYEIVGRVSDGTAALRLLPQARPDLLILDVQMPELGGIEVLRTLRARGDARPVVLITGTIDDRRLLDALRLGANGLLLKAGTSEQLLACLDEVRRGGRWIEPSILQRALDLALAGDSGDDPFRALTPRERSIVELVAQGQRNREIASQLGMSEGTVKLHLHRIFQKLAIGSRTELAILAARQPAGKSEETPIES